MINRMRKFRIVISSVFSLASLILLFTSPAMAAPIAFNLGFGGTVSYAGGNSAFTTTNGAVIEVGNGLTTLSIAGGDLDFATGNYIGGGATADGFENIYAGGGSVTIHGDIGSGVVLLMEGRFANNSTFRCCNGSSPVFSSSFNGILEINYIDPNLAAVLGFNLPAAGGSLSQVQIFFGASPSTSGVAFSGTQAGGALSVSEAVVDLLDPVSELLSGTNLTSITPNLLTLATKGRRVDGVAADGTAKLVFRFNAPSAGRVSFFLVDQDNQPLFRHEEDGTLTDLGGSQVDSFVFVNTNSVIKEGREQHKAFAIYNSPSNFVRANSPDDVNLEKRRVFIKTQFVSLTGQVTEVPPVPINILRPPVILVHGIWSSSAAWNGFNPLIKDRRFFIRKVDYSDLSDDEFADGADRTYNKIGEFLNEYRMKKNASAIRADIVTHSMGGPVIRTMALKSNFLLDPARPTYGKGPVGRVITIAGVHLGSKMANFLIANPCAADFFNDRLGKPTGNGAVSDLAEGSEAINRINTQRTPFSVHTIIGQANNFQKSEADILLDLIDGFYCDGNVFRGVNSILGNDNDAMVGANSQAGGRNGPATTFNSVTHSPPFSPPNELGSVDIANRIIELLNSIEVSLFSPLP